MMEGKSQQGKQKRKKKSCVEVQYSAVELWACVWKESFGLRHVTPGGHRRRPGFEVRAFAEGGEGLCSRRGSGG